MPQDTPSARAKRPLAAGKENSPPTAQRKAAEDPPPNATLIAVLARLEKMEGQ